VQKRGTVKTNRGIRKKNSFKLLINENYAVNLWNFQDKLNKFLDLKIYLILTPKAFISSYIRLLQQTNPQTRKIFMIFRLLPIIVFPLRPFE
jgi:hypothetical protein